MQLVVITLVSIGLGLIWMGVRARIGTLKSLYLVKGIPGIYPSGYIYAFIPVGVAFLILALVLLLPSPELRANIIGFGSWGVILLSVTLMIWKPRWLKPWWLQWLEDNYGDILEEILEEARNTKDFEQQAATEAELAIWANAVAQKYR